MGNYSAEWAEDEARALAAHIGRTVSRLESLADRYGQLRGMLGDVGQPAGGGDEVRTPSRPGSRPPLRVDVLDLLADVERFVEELLPLVRGTLRLGPAVGAGRSVLAGLGIMGAGLAGVYSEDPGLGDAVSSAAWKLERRAAWIFGDRSRAFALTEPCASCGMPALWVVPERMVIRCGNPACRATRPVDVVLPVHVSGAS
jgi:hypothetical protein